MKEKIERKLNLASDGSAGVDDENSRLKDNRSQIENVTIESKDLLSKPIIESEEFVSILGVKLPKGLGGNETPNKKRFADIERSLTNEDLRLMQKIALAIKLNQPILIEEYSGSGKTTKVEHICALTENPMFYANCHDFDTDVLIGKMTTNEKTKSGFGWQDGIVMKAVRNGGILFLDEYNFMRGETRARMHEILDALLRGKEKISLIENNGELVEVNPNLRIVAAQNPPGGEFGNREVLDPAQYTRFIQIKGPSRMSKETKLARTLGFLGKDNAITISKEDYLLAEARLTPEQLAEIDGIEEIFEKFVEFEEGVVEMVAKRKAGADQSQPIYFAFQRDIERVRQFVQMFFNGDINETFQKALKYYYVERFESETDRLKIEEMIKKVAYMPKQESKRKGTKREKPAEEKRAETTTIEKPIEKSAKSSTKDIIDSMLKKGSIPEKIREKITSAKEKILKSSESLSPSEAKEILKQDFL
ncbi:MAG TPA: AAA family ATPase, partial [Paludibacteraceae bacterium]|nr:AAA family ATPase [Paludibacteraceae bacterium]